MAPARAPGVAEGKKVVPTPTDDDVSAIDRIKALLGGSMSGDVYQGWGSSLLREATIVSASSTPVGRCTFSFTVSSTQCNRLGNLHGGCAATIFDVCTTAALAPIAKPGYWAFAGVSRTLNVTYLRPIPEGEEVLVECEVVHAGKRLCTLKGEMRRKRDGAVMAICEHGKVSIDPKL